ncbi:hypothetical protein [Ruminiclostridium cellobioparum]|uniref:hypothetical protein n=1 Tax=Ruminiclostridium cellobioparum TaxID=29355 RepID=UPI0028AC2033|nr:hypothetical protein [Ruminiclostridium cellobioparum]
MRLEKYRDTRYWAVFDDTDELICLTVYRKGAQEVIRRLSLSPAGATSAVERTVPEGVKKLLKEMKSTSGKFNKLAKELQPYIK